MNKTLPDLIATRHQGALTWIASHLPVPAEGGRWYPRMDTDGNGFMIFEQPRLAETDEEREMGETTHRGIEVWSKTHSIPVRREITPADLTRKQKPDGTWTPPMVVLGNLPMSLAALCGAVIVIEFAGPQPRGGEYTAAEMDLCGARLRSYIVLDRLQAVAAENMYGAPSLFGVSPWHLPE